MAAPASALPSSIASYTTPNFSTPVPFGAPVWPPAARRLQLSAAEWDELKDTIQQLYIDEGKRFKEVAVILQTNHNFTPSKKMFDDKIKRWGLRKNANRVQRRVFLEKLHENDGGMKGLKDGTSFMVNPGKIERWEREEKLSGSFGKVVVVYDRKVAVASVSKAADQTLSDRELSPLREIIDISVAPPEASYQPQTMWDMADIPRSPKLSRFFDLIKIAEEFPMPPPFCLPPRDPKFITREDWSDLVKKSVNKDMEREFQSSSAVVRSSQSRQRSPCPTALLIESLLSQIEKPWTPWNEVYPFPNNVEIRKGRKGRSGIPLEVSPATFRDLKIVESESRLRQMQKVLSPESPGLVAEMNQLARLYFEAGKYGHAETLWQRVALATQDALGPNNVDTLWAYFHIILAKYDRGQWSHALNLHRDLDSRIQTLYNPRHDLAFPSRILLGGIFAQLGQREESEKVGRDVLQIALETFGLKSYRTVRALSNLSRIMLLLNQPAEAERLLRTALPVASQVTEDFLVLYEIKVNLATALERQEGHADTSKLLKNALSPAMLRFGMEHTSTLFGILQLSASMTRMGQAEESEILLRPNLRRHRQVQGTAHAHTCMNYQQLAIVMLEKECWTEAADLLEHLFKGNTAVYGHDHNYTSGARNDLSYCYEMQGLYLDQQAFDDKMKNVLESKMDMPDILTQRRKYGRISEAIDDEEEVEEIRPEKRRRTRTMTCTFNLKGGYN